MKAVLVEIDALSPAFMGCYGNDWAATPTLDRLAWEGVVFDQHFVDTPIADAAGQPRSLWTGNYHFPRRALMGEMQGEPDAPARASPSIADRLRGHGVSLEEVHVTTGLDLVGAAGPALGAFASWERGLLWIHGPSLRPPWALPADVASCYFDEEDDEDIQPWLDPPEGPISEGALDRLLCLQNTYAAAVTFLDAQLGRLIEALEEAGLLQTTALWLTASSGLPLGEHGQVGFADADVHAEFAHIPLLVRLPRESGQGRRITGLSQPVDVATTLLDYLEVPAPGLHGVSLRPLVEEKTGAVRASAVSAWCSGGRQSWALRTPGWTLLKKGALGDVDTAAGLFTRPDDRWERNDVSGHHHEWAAEAETLLAELVRAAAGPGPLAFPAEPL